MMNQRERKNAKIVFWCASPIMFLGLARLFFLFFYFVYGLLLYWILGGRFHTVILVLATATSIFFSGAVVVLLYRMFKVHILEEN